MRMKKVASLFLTATIAASALAGCSTGNGGGKSADGKTTIEFWAAPNPTQQVYWKEMAEKFEKENPKIDVKVSPMKESPTSEASIQSAIAGKSAPTMSENINRGFAAQLAESKALVPLNEVDGWDELIKNRSMTDTIKTWKFSDDNQYVMPIYSNPMLFGWRIDILKEAGVDKMPATYSEVLDAAKKLKAKYPDKYVWAKPELADPTAHLRWFDFFMLYDAASGGNHFIEGDKFVADDEAGINALTLMSDLKKEDAILTKQATDIFESGLGIFTDLGPWTFSYWEEKFPEMKYNETFGLSLPPVPDGADTENVNTFSDTKGIVIYASATKEERKAAMEFMNFVYSNPENDLKWLETTKLPPARDDLSSNESFKAFFEKNPELKPYADAIPNAIPSIDNAKYNELQTHIGRYAVNPIVKGEVDPEKGWKEMKKAIKEELKK
ncbi:ABC transporter substrate-binding protein [Fictibacillus phosphorivorans]|uniref:ABC transporter substrate-binding protein n=1 Tax=Fictibacillus phosphorivorans TaxID=1221500 RepID=UPI00203E1397|nr:extracellular solute-binding protein [Fictibacillus phosphorivorans]MCM3717833.1 extracellular solute-binding protein [Fictibacillus phosphorivorans]MCM3777061.1 extracellular solute-binding protein [Fictibacillus phosphorivorans]